jgi:tRNA modification GTPase
VTADSPPPTPDSRRPDATQFCVLTPAGRGAIATIAVRGAEAAVIVGRHLQTGSGKPLHAPAVGRVAFGRFSLSPDLTEEVVIGRPAVDEIEIHCHGGAAVVAAICHALASQGGVGRAPELWIADQEPDPLAADALLALRHATTERTAAILLDQHRGALRVALGEIERLLGGLDSAGAAAALHSLLARADLGRHLTRPWRVVVAGAPNAGKSSLVNAILGYQRAIVWHQPGTTRDVLTATTAIDGWPIELADTAGLRATDDALEAEGVLRAQQQVAASDLVLFVAETTAPWDSPLFESMLATAQRVIVVHNKCDLALPPADGRRSGSEVSANTGHGLEKLCAAIADSLTGPPPPRGAAIPFTEEHVESLTRAMQHLARGDFASASSHLAALSRQRTGVSR